MSPSPPHFAHRLETRIQTLALTLRSGTVDGYRSATRGFVYLGAAFPHVQQLSELRRDPHLLGWFRSHCDRRPPLSPKTRHNYLLCLRRLFDDLTLEGHPLHSDLIRREDLPLQPRYLPKPLSPSEDQLLQQELRRTDDLLAHALLLTRATGIRIGECIDLTADCLQPAGECQWQLHVPLGKLHTERMVPADENTHRIVARMLALRSSAPLPTRPHGDHLVLPCSNSHDALHQGLAVALTDAARRAGCTTRVTPHRLRHTFASEMVRLGVSLPALMRILGHKDIRMTMRYMEVTQPDLQQEFHAARENTAQPHRVPVLHRPQALTGADPAGIRQAISTARHLLELYRRKSEDEKERRRLQRLDKRLLAVASNLEKERCQSRKMRKD
jgi:site-specific recombinase XerD